MDLNRIAIFVRVVEAQSFTAAAAALGLPKSSVSRSITRLEEDLGVRLLQRTTRKLSLTEAGRAYFETTRTAISGIDDATAAVADMGKEPRGTVRLTAPPDLSAAILPDILGRFAQKHRNIHVELSLTSRTVDLVEEGFDLAIRAGQLQDSSLVARKIGTTYLGLFASPLYLRRRGRPKTPAELASHDCVLFRGRAGQATWSLTGADGEETNVTVRGPIDVDDLAFVERAIARGIGIGMLPLFLCARKSSAQPLVRILPEYRFRGAPLHIVAPSRRYEPARVARLREFLLEHLADVRWEG